MAQTVGVIIGAEDRARLSPSFDRRQQRTASFLSPVSSQYVVDVRDGIAARHGFVLRFLGGGKFDIKQQKSVSADEIVKAIGLDPSQLEATLGVLSLLGAIKQHDDGRVEMADTIRFVGIPSV
ncbi:hypothetical protein [Azospirillum sp. TSH64]|uniref:DprA-like winged helix domain-containing protein n=1 Tax=Azospirillum sp. TSH64 TaxID=652740 RepID=UPI000D60F760|nr:hypothetical protein [Azospirillum sp. TSH64]PWC74696.1 hypothetical protein TSH64_06670 [Azospirillum sp. TSH64]